MNFEPILKHHLLNHSLIPFYIHVVDFGLTHYLLMMWIVSAITVAVSIGAARAEGGAGILLRSGMESIILYIRDEMMRPIFHDETDYYLPYFLTLFFFILIANFAGMVPDAPAVMGNISVTLALALCTFILIQFAGIRAQGLISYLKHIVPGGTPWWLVPLLFVIEIFGLCAKCIALCIRLFANIVAGHMVALACLSLIFIFAQMNHYVGFISAPFAVGLTLFSSLLDLLVAALQAYIFTILTALFVGFAVHPH